MKATACPICDYSLVGIAPEADCPECGAWTGQRRSTSRRRSIARRFTWVYILLMAPSWCSMICLVLGWSIAHLFIGIPKPHWVQTGEYPVLDLLCVFAVWLLLSSLISFVAVPFALPAAVILHSRVPTANPERRWRAYLFLIVLAAPVVLEIAMMRPFGGVAWGLVDWWPD